MPFLSLLTGGLGKIIGYGLLTLMISGAGLYALHTHDNAVRAEMQVASDKAIFAAQAADAMKASQALQAAQADAAKRIAALSSIKEKTHSVPVTTACAHSPAVNALLNGLRGSNTNGSGATP